MMYDAYSSDHGSGVGALVSSAVSSSSADATVYTRASQPRVRSSLHVAGEHHMLARGLRYGDLAQLEHLEHRLGHADGACVLQPRPDTTEGASREKLLALRVELSFLNSHICFPRWID